MVILVVAELIIETVVHQEAGGQAKKCQKHMQIFYIVGVRL